MIQNEIEIIDLDHYKPTGQDRTCSIDIILENEGLCRVPTFKYNIGDCLFDSLEFLLNYRYKSLELRNETIDYFLQYKQEGKSEALHLYSTKLHPQTLYELQYMIQKDICVECDFLQRKTYTMEKIYSTFIHYQSG